MLDLDHFKRFNDARGHQAGDRLLADTTAAWREHLRDADLLARVGGEEFVVVLPECGTQLAVQIVDRLRGATPFGQTCSAGVALWDGSESVEGLIGRADAALYQAKEQGRDRTVVPERIS
jgi:diguanylate cyclase (GGDEF)-like protein